MRSKTFSIRDALNLGWNNLEDNFKTFAGAMAIIAVVSVISFILNMGSSFFEAVNTNLPLGLNILIALFSFVILLGLNIISMMLYYGVKKIAIKGHDEQDVKINDMFLNYQIVLKLLLFHLALAIVGTIALLLVGGFVAILATVLGIAFENPWLIGLLIVVVLSLITYLFMRLFFITYFIVDDNIKLFQAVEYSLKITDGAAGKLFLLNVILVIINLVGLVFGLVLGSIFVTQPFGISTMAGVYNKLAKRSGLDNLLADENTEIVSRDREESNTPEQEDFSDSVVENDGGFTQE